MSGAGRAVPGESQLQGSWVFINLYSSCTPPHQLLSTEFSSLFPSGPPIVSRHGNYAQRDAQ